MRTSLRHHVAAAAVAALLVPLAACGSDDPDADRGGSEPSGSSSAAPLPTPTTATAEDGTTAPGSVLELGDTALVPLDASSGDGSARVRATVTAVEPTDAATPSWADDGDVVYRIDATVTVESWTGTDRLGVNAWLTGAVGERPVGKADPSASADVGCEAPLLGPAEEPGATVDVCVTAVAPADATVLAAWASNGSAYGYDGGAPLLWLP